MRRVAVVSAVLGLAGCACLVDEGVTLSQAPRGASDSKTARSTSRPPRQTPRESAAQAPRVDAALLKRTPAPDCSLEGASKPEEGSDEAGNTADPNLVEIARLQLERDCYRKAEAAARSRLNKLQSAVTPGS